MMAGWWAELLDVKVAFLHGEFKEGHKVYMGVVPTTRIQEILPKELCIVVIENIVHG